MVKNKKIRIAVGVFLLTVFVSSCNRAVTGEQTDVVVDETEVESVLMETAHEHTPWDAIRENEVAPTCEDEGCYDAVVYCSSCGDELSRAKKIIAAVGHWYENRFCIDCGAEQPSEGLTFVVYGDGTCFVTGRGNCTDERIVIPSVSPQGIKVTGINDYAFAGCEGLVSVYIPDSVTLLGIGVFEDCPDLESVRLPSGLYSLPDALFKNCRRLKDVAIPAGVKVIGREAFWECVAFEHLVIPSSVFYIYADAFMNFSSVGGTIRFENRFNWWCFDQSGAAVRDFDLSDEAKNVLYIALMFSDCNWARAQQ